MNRSTVLLVGIAALSIISTVADARSEEHTSELQSRLHLVCRLLLEKKNNVSEYSTSVSHITTNDHLRPVPRPVPSHARSMPPERYRKHPRGLVVLRLRHVQHDGPPR